MKYISTRGQMQPQGFSDILLEGLAPDGGLAVPESIPKVSADMLERWRGLPYHALAAEVLSLFISDIAAEEIARMTREAYRLDVFRSEDIVPVRALYDGMYLLGLSEGPTLAFKDMAMQFLGQVFPHVLRARGTTLNILGATSGDTGSAAEYAMRGKEGVAVFMLSPHGRMSAFQRAQMYSLQDANIHNIAVTGVFDEAQDIVKALSSDLAFKSRYRMGAVNSINWARLLAQVVYYFAGYFQVISSSHSNLKLGSPVSFTVPSGNFGNVCAGHVARMMGLPIDRLVVATNENDVLDEFFKTGVYKVRTSQNTHETSSPSMDISKASNFERFIFDLLDRDSALTKQLFASEVAIKGSFDLSKNKYFGDVLDKFGFVSGRSTHADRLKTIQSVYKDHHQMIDPHTADGVKVAREQMSKHASTHQTQSPMVVLETALPIKFASTIVEALGVEPVRPSQFNGIEALARRVQNMPADVDKIKAYIDKHCSQ